MRSHDALAAARTAANASGELPMTKKRAFTSVDRIASTGNPRMVRTTSFTSQPA
jgi:hypothetical protein